MWNPSVVLYDLRSGYVVKRVRLEVSNVLVINHDTNNYQFKLVVYNYAILYYIFINIIIRIYIILSWNCNNLI